MLLIKNNVLSRTMLVVAHYTAPRITEWATWTAASGVWLELRFSRKAAAMHPEVRVRIRTCAADLLRRGSAAAHTGEGLNYR